MDMVLNQPLSETEQDELADFLDSDLVPEDSMDICMLHGYLTAIAIGPVTLLPSEWLPRVWGDAGEPAFDSLEHAQRILDLVVRYYNEIVLTFMEAPEQFLPYLYEYEDKHGEEPTISAEEWCVGFSLGVHLRSKDWEPLIANKEFTLLLAPIATFSLEAAGNEIIEGPNSDEAREDLIALLPTAVQGIHAYWQTVREKRPPGLVPDSFRLGGSSKVRRNALCPCGSGKKYKKCCGAAVKM
jgi:uncharacterized protein